MNNKKKRHVEQPIIDKNTAYRGEYQDCKHPSKTAVNQKQPTLRVESEIHQSGSASAMGQSGSTPAMVVGRAEDNQEQSGGSKPTGGDARASTLVLSCCDANNIFDKIARKKGNIPNCFGYRAR